MSKLLELTSVSKYYHDGTDDIAALQDIDLTINEGDR